MFSTDSRVLAAFAVTTSLAASLCFTVLVGAAHAQATEEGTAEPRRDDEHAGGSRGGVSWGHEGDEGGSGGSGAPVHRYSRIFASVGAGFSTRIIQYLELVQDRLGPPYLQLRPGYFFEGEGTFQHGVMLGVATGLWFDPPDPDIPFGPGPGTQWVLAPSYALRLWLDGDLGRWLQLTGRVGVPLTLGTDFSWGVDVGLGVIFEFLTGLGLYVEADFSMFFAADIHPLFSLEGGIVVEYEVLP